MKDTAGNQSNALSREIKINISEVKPEEKNYTHIVVLSDLHLPGRNIPLKGEAIGTIDSWPDVDMVVLLGDIGEEFGTVEELNREVKPLKVIAPKKESRLLKDGL